MQQQTLKTRSQNLIWPLASLYLQVLTLLATIFLIRFLGAWGVLVATAFVWLVPTESFPLMIKRRQYAEVARVLIIVLIILYPETLPQLFGGAEGQSKISIPLALAVLVATASGIKSFPRRYLLPVGMLALFLATRVFHVNFAAAPLDSALRPMGFFITLLLFLIVTADAQSLRFFSEKLSVVVAYLAGYYFIEMASGGGTFSISSTQINGEAGRAAGLYANANNAGAVVTQCGLLIVLACRSYNATLMNKHRLIAVLGFCTIAAVMTFSRQAMIMLVPTILLGAWQLSGKRLVAVFAYGPLAIFCLLVFAVFSVVLIEEIGGELSADARGRFEGIANIIGVEIDPRKNGTASDRFENLNSSRRFWTNPTIFGYGYNFFMTETDVDLPHNEFILILVENGIVGVVVFISFLVSSIGKDAAKSRDNLLSTSMCALSVLLFLVWTPSALEYRFFVVPFGLVIWASRNTRISSDTSVRQQTPKCVLRGNQV